LVQGIEFSGIFVALQMFCFWTKSIQPLCFSDEKFTFFALLEQALITSYKYLCE
jgi:hypothetical protein